MWSTQHNSIEYSGKCVLVTGASRGIGKNVTKKLLTAGYDVHILARNVSDLRDVASEYGNLGKISFNELDLSVRDALADFCKDWDKPLYGIVNNAGTCITESIQNPLTLSSITDWDTVLGINLVGPYMLVKGLLPHMTRPGRIVNIASQLGLEGRATYDSYCASKFGLIGLTKCWAKELGQDGITVNAVCPGWVNTKQAKVDLTRLAQEQGKHPDLYYQEVCGPLELKRFTSPEEVSNLIAFLLSPEASGITGRDWLMNTIWNQE